MLTNIRMIIRGGFVQSCFLERMLNRYTKILWTCPFVNVITVAEARFILWGE